MPEIGLQGAGVVALVGQRKAAGVAQHVRVDLERDPGFDAGPFHPAVVNGPARSLVKTNGDLGACSRRSLRSARSSSPMIGWVLGVPRLTRRTCRVAVAKSIWSHRRSVSSDALRPCRHATRIMVLSRWPQRLRFAASVSWPTSASVRCSRLRISALGRRFGVTVRFSVVGATSVRCDLAMTFPASANGHFSDSLQGRGHRARRAEPNKADVSMPPVAAAVTSRRQPVRRWRASPMPGSRRAGDRRRPSRPSWPRNSAETGESVFLLILLMVGSWRVDGRRGMNKHQARAAAMAELRTAEGEPLTAGGGPCARRTSMALTPPMSRNVFKASRCGVFATLQLRLVCWRAPRVDRVRVALYLEDEAAAGASA
jgi:hypothetical protein